MACADGRNLDGGRWQIRGYLFDKYNFFDALWIKYELMGYCVSRYVGNWDGCNDTTILFRDRWMEGKDGTYY